MANNSHQEARALRDLGLGRVHSGVLSVRVPLALREHLCAQARAIGVPAGTYLRGLVILASSPRDPEKTLASIARLLDLDPASATPDEIQGALADLLLADQPPTDAGATGEVADPAPLRQLTKAEREYCALNKLTPAQFVARKAGAVRRAPTRPTARKATR